MVKPILNGLFQFCRNFVPQAFESDLIGLPAAEPKTSSIKLPRQQHYFFAAATIALMTIVDGKSDVVIEGYQERSTTIEIHTTFKKAD